MRIASLLSSATEIVHALGATDRLVAISHECDHPPEAMGLPRLSRSRFDPEGLDSGEVDAAVRQAMIEHGSVYQVDEALLRNLRPDVVLTQAICEVCAVPSASAREIVERMSPPPRVVSLDAHDVGEILHTIEQVGEAIGEVERAREVIASIRARFARISEAVADRPRPDVLVLEWLDPPFDPGHWMPEMVELAGGHCLRGAAGAPSRQVAWSDLEGVDPDVLLIAPCGWGIAEAQREAAANAERLERVAPRALESGRAYLLDGTFFSRSGPRVVQGVEALAQALHPGTFGAEESACVAAWSPASNLSNDR